MAGFELMGNHYHLVMRFDPRRSVSAKELWDRALRLYPGSEKKLLAWPRKRWRRLQQRIFDISEFMRNVQAAFARWFNKTKGRKGHLWGSRFKSNVLADAKAILESVL